VPIFIGRGAPVIPGSVPETWVTFHSEDVGRRLVRHRLAKRDGEATPSSGSASAPHCTNLSSAKENMVSRKVRPCQKSCDKSLRCHTIDRGAPCALYPAIKRSTSRASTLTRHSSTNCYETKAGESMARADFVPTCIRRVSSLVTLRTPKGPIPATRSRRGCAGPLLFRSRKARQTRSDIAVRLGNSFRSKAQFSSRYYGREGQRSFRQAEGSNGPTCRRHHIALTVIEMTTNATRYQ
jgi:hypothetical protein